MFFFFLCLHVEIGEDHENSYGTFIFLNQVGDLIGVYPDLMDAFRVFLVQCEKNGNHGNLFFRFLHSPVEG